MTTATPPDSPVRLYTGFRRPVSWGINRLGAGGTIILGVGLIVVIITAQIAGPLTGAVVGMVLGGFLLTLMMRDKHNRTGLTRAGVHLGWFQHRRRKAHIYTSGPTGKVPSGRYQLPGIPASSRLSEHTDSLDRPFALLHLRSRNHYTVVFTCQPNGAPLVDQDTINERVHQWGLWLQTLGNEPGLLGASVTVETAPDTGTRLRREVETNVRKDAHDLPQAMFREIVDEFPVGQAQTRAWVTLTFAGFAGRKRTPAEVAEDLATRLPNLTSSLTATGAGSVRPTTAVELCEVVRTAYDPASAKTFDDARAHGQPIVLDWSDVGPTAGQEEWDRYRHDSAVSVTWAMSQPPAGAVTDRVLAQLTAPDPRIDRKRVTLLFAPKSAQESVKLVDRDVNNANFRAKTGRGNSRSAADLAAAQLAADEQAQLGATVVDFSLLVTATVFDPARLPEARAAIEAAGATSRITLRQVYRGQAHNFAACLPLGLLLRTHLKVNAGESL